MVIAFGEAADKKQELARNNDELEKELEKQGLDKKLARLSEEQLRQALQKAGLDSDKIEDLMRKAAAGRMAMSRCAGLGRAMGACGMGAGGLSADELASVMGQLDDLESLQQQLNLTQATLDEIARNVDAGDVVPLREGEKSADGRTRFFVPERTGFYQIKSPKGDRWIAVNLFDAGESEARGTVKVVRVGWSSSKMLFVVPAEDGPLAADDLVRIVGVFAVAI